MMLKTQKRWEENLRAIKVIGYENIKLVRYESTVGFYESNYELQVL
jgi:hypothetical protein